MDVTSHPWAKWNEKKKWNEASYSLAIVVCDRKSHNWSHTAKSRGVYKKIILRYKTALERDSHLMTPKTNCQHLNNLLLLMDVIKKNKRARFWRGNGLVVIGYHPRDLGTITRQIDAWGTNHDWGFCCSYARLPTLIINITTSSIKTALKNSFFP